MRCSVLQMRTSSVLRDNAGTFCLFLSLRLSTGQSSKVTGSLLQSPRSAREFGGVKMNVFFLVICNANTAALSRKRKGKSEHFSPSRSS